MTLDQKIIDEQEADKQQSFSFPDLPADYEYMSKTEEPREDQEFNKLLSYIQSCNDYDTSEYSADLDGAASHQPSAIHRWNSNIETYTSYEPQLSTTNNNIKDFTRCNSENYEGSLQVCRKDMDELWTYNSLLLNTDNNHRKVNKNRKDIVMSENFTETTRQDCSKEKWNFNDIKLEETFKKFRSVNLGSKFPCLTSYRNYCSTWASTGRMSAPTSPLPTSICDLIYNNKTEIKSQETTCTVASASYFTSISKSSGKDEALNIFATKNKKIVDDKYSNSVGTSMTSINSLSPLEDRTTFPNHSQLDTERTSQPYHNRPKRNEKSLRLWEWLYFILHDSNYTPRYICWESQRDGIFRFVRSELVARLWGQRNGNSCMTYDKMSRAMRHYYKRNVITRYDNRKLVYKFNAETLKRLRLKQALYNLQQ